MDLGASADSLPICPVCCDLLGRYGGPSTLPCGHNGCLDCFAHVQSRNAFCPLCRAPFDPQQQLACNHELKDLINMANSMFMDDNTKEEGWEAFPTAKLMAAHYASERDVVLMEPPQWLPDSYASHCGTCQLPFKPLLRLRHHCRLCGKLFCHGCSSKQLLLPPRFKERDPQRVCGMCASLLEPLQPFLVGATAASVQPPVHDALDAVSLRSWLNSPWAGSMAGELYKAANILRKFNEAIRLEPERGIPAQLLAGARGLALLSVVRLGAGWSCTAGTGIVVSRQRSGAWSAPCAAACYGLGWGLQLGGELTDVLLVLKTDEAVRAFASGSTIGLGGSVGLALGPVGRSAEASFRVGSIAARGSVVGYSCSQGAFVGASLEGSVTCARDAVNKKFYGYAVSAGQLADKPPPAAAAAAPASKHTAAQPLQQQQDFTALLQPATPEQGTAPAGFEQQQQQPPVFEQPITEQPVEQQLALEQQVAAADQDAPAAPAAHTAAAPAPPTKSSAANDAEAEATAKSKDFDSWNTSPTCSYPKTAANVNLDKLGRPWGFDGATKQSCTFKDASAAAAGTISWDAAKDCPYQLTDSNALPDSHGRLWGYDGVARQSCAFKSQTLPAAKSENGATSAAAAAATAGPPPGHRMSQITDLQQQQQPGSGGYCIPVQRRASFHVLAAGDSITQGSVPSRGFNYPYAIKLEELLRKKLGPRTRAIDAGLGGGGIYQTGFNIQKRFPEFYREQLAFRQWDVAVIMIGINDLLRGGTPAAEIMAGLQPLLDETLAKGIPVVSIPPFAAPGFVAETDSKEAERKKMAELLKAAAAARAAATGGQGPQIWVLDLQAGPLDFYKMSPEERSRWLDDGLHMTQFAYEQLGQYVYDEVMSHLCNLPQLGLLDYAQVSAQEASYSIWRNAARARP
ncbi:hypothetical protein OEZ85_012727 [Tetradesmus obliquus]|uniref:FYVE-type domain-containing protein n=1 Tax=Tetradesmus obliquus TaxID=3088 RepID=A0ABY8U3G5_TETOB|nr:hypothetical protein OEZ85_012727 [Tetradesmus obliquus]